MPSPHPIWPPQKGRGALSNRAGRFEPVYLGADPDEIHEWDGPDPDLPPLKTQCFKDDTQTLITTNDSPDIPFSASINPYRGCEHGCIYCYARPTHEYLGLSAGLDFESKIFAKMHAAEILRKELNKRSWIPKSLALSGVTDCYQPIDRHLKLTRQCLEVLAACRQPVGLVTKSSLICRDIDYLQELARFKATRVMISVTTLDGELARRLEPRAPQPTRRLQTIRKLADAGIPVGVMIAPVIPGMTDEEIPAILEAAAHAGAASAGYVLLRLPYSLKELVAQWLDIHFPERKDRVLSHLRNFHGGKLYRSDFGQRQRGTGVFADMLRQTFDVQARRAGFQTARLALNATAFRRPSDSRQPDLFDLH